jgi:hypothetical protein
MPAVAGLHITKAYSHNSVNGLYTLRIYGLTVILIKVGADIPHAMLTTTQSRGIHDLNPSEDSQYAYLTLQAV